MSGVTDRDHVDGVALRRPTDEQMRERLGQTKEYVLVLLKRAEKYSRPDVDLIIWEHGRRNFALADHGVLSVVLPVMDDGTWAGVGVFGCSPEEVRRIMDSDPGVEAGVFSYEVHPVRGFPGASLPR